MESVWYQPRRLSCPGWRAKTGRGTISTEHALLLAVIQGITEFAPVSSSAHLALFPALFGTADQGLVIDVAAHAGTLVAVTVVLWSDVLQILGGLWHLLAGPRDHPDARMALVLVIATIPAVIMGAWLAASGLAYILRDVEVIAWSTIGFGLLLYVADRWGRTHVRMSDLGPLRALAIGCLQVCAFLPGASRAGVTMTAGRVLGMGRETAVRVAFLLAIPTLGTATAHGAWSLHKAGDPAQWEAAGLVFALSFLSAILALWLLARFVRRWSLAPFVAYRLILGAGLLWFFSS